MPTIRRPELIAVSALALVSLLAAFGLFSWHANGLVGRYWNNAEWTGTPVAETTSCVPGTADFLRHVPNAEHGVGSAEWTGFLLVDRAGPQVFNLRSDDGAWLYIDDVLVVDDGGLHGVQSVDGHVNLPAGHHRVRLRYFQLGGRLTFEVRWTKPGGSWELLRAFDLSPTEPAGDRRALRAVENTLSILIPVVWGCLFLYVPIRLAGWWMWREVRRAAPRAEDRRALLVVLCIAFGLMVWGLEWGLAGDQWAADELPPGLVRDALQAGFSGGWYDKYPVWHYAVLSIPVSAFEVASRYGILAADSLASHVAQLALMRMVSVFMGLGALVAAYLCGVELYGPRRAVLAALALLLTPLCVFYGKTANLDIPALCWFGWALLAFLRIWRANRFADYVLLGVAAAGAVATKDQAYANLALLPFAALVANARHQPAPSWLRRLGSAAVDSRIWTAGLAAALASGVFHNVLFNLSGFVAHFKLLSTLGDLAVVPRTVAGYLAMTWTTVALFPFVFGWPLFVMTVIGLARAAVRPERRWWLWLLIVPLSFHLTFTCVTLYVNDRYLFGGVFVLALFAGSAWADLLEARVCRRVAWCVVAGSMIYSLLYAASINVMMNLDARHAARRWVYAHAVSGTTVWLVGSYQPALNPPARVVGDATSAAGIKKAEPDLVVINARFAHRFEGERRPDGRELMRALEDGSLGYAEVFRSRSPVPAWALLQYEAPFKGLGESPLTNLDKANPEMVIYRKAAGNR